MALKKVQASALVYSIFIMLIVLIILGSILMVYYLNSLFVFDITQKENVIDNVNSATNLVLAEPEIVHINDSISLSLFDGHFDSVYIKRKRWGLIDLYFVNAAYKNFSYKRAFMSGGYFKNRNNTALYLPERKRALAITGNTLIRGYCQIPSAGIKAAFIEGRFYEREKLVYGTTAKSDVELPRLLPLLDSVSLESTLYNFILQDKYTKTEWESDFTEPLEISFYKDPLILYKSSNISLKNCKISDHVMIISESQITIDSSARLNNVVLSAPVIRIKSGFEGIIQCIASDSLILEEKCTLNYPSVLYLHHTQNNQLELMKIGDSSNVIGMIVVNTLINDKKKHISLKINQGSEIEGQAYCNAYTSLSGSIYGSLYTYGFLMQTSSGLYENHVLDAVIDIERLGDNYTGINITEVESPGRIMQWIY